MRFGGQVDDRVYLKTAEKGFDQLGIGDVALDKAVVGRLFDILQVLQIAGVGQFVQIEDPIMRVLVHKMSDHMRTNKTGSSSYQNGSNLSHCASAFFSGRKGIKMWGCVSLKSPFIPARNWNRAGPA